MDIQSIWPAWWRENIHANCMYLIFCAFKHWRLSCLKLQTTVYMHFKPEIKSEGRGFYSYFKYLWVADVGVFIHMHTTKLFSLLVDLDIGIIKETHSCESGKSSRLGTGRKHQAVYSDSQIITSIGDILTSMFSSKWRFIFLNIFFILTFRDCSEFWKHSYPKRNKHLQIYVTFCCWKAIYHLPSYKFRVYCFIYQEVNKSMSYIWWRLQIITTAEKVPQKCTYKFCVSRFFFPHASNV